MRFFMSLYNAPIAHDPHRKRTCPVAEEPAAVTQRADAVRPMQHQISGQTYRALSRQERQAQAFRGLTSERIEEAVNHLPGNRQCDGRAVEQHRMTAILILILYGLALVASLVDSIDQRNGRK